MFRTLVVCLIGLASLGRAASGLPEKYARWLNEEVTYIITDEEKKAFLKLEEDPARDQFIQSFWEARNPARGTGNNPARDEHYRRLQYANENFGRESGTPGWRTDMGRTWILFGKPDERIPLKGYSELYPMELWTYSNKTGSNALPGFFYVAFFMPEDIGEYRFYRPFSDGPLKLVRGSNFRSDRDVYTFLQKIRGDVAHAAFSLIPSEPIDTDTFKPSMTGDALVARIQDWANSPDQVRRIREGRMVTERVHSVVLLTDQKPLTVDIAPLAGFDGNWWLDYAVLVDDPDYGVANNAMLAVRAGFRLLSKSGDLIAEDSEERAFEAFGSDGAFTPFLLANRIPMTPGAYRLEVTLTNSAKNKIFKAERPLEIGPSVQPALSAPLLASAVERVADGSSDAPFQFGGFQFVPAIDRSVPARVPLRTFVEIRTPAPAADWTLEYVVANVSDRDQRFTTTDRTTAPEFRNGVLLKARTLPIEKLAAGDYRVIVNLRTEGSQQIVASTSSSLRIVDDPKFRKFYALSNLRGAASNGVAAYLRGLEATAQNDRSAAAQYLRESLRLNPANVSARAALARLH